MGIASLIIGIISILIGFIPIINILMILPAMVALILGIIDWVKKNKAGLSKGKAVAGTICSAVALIIIMVVDIFSVSLLAIIGASVSNEMDTYNYSYDYDDYDYDYDYDDYYDYY